MTINQAFLRGALIGPLVVFPLTLLFMIGGVLYSRNLGGLSSVLETSLILGGQGALIAYIAMLVYGTPVFWLLNWKRWLSLITLLVSSIVPFVIYYLFLNGVLFWCVGGAIYAIAVSFTAWYVGLRHVECYNNAL